MEYLTNDTALTNMANAIRTKTGSSSLITYDETLGFKTAIDAIPTGGGGFSDKPIEFMDYDGTTLFEYTYEEAQALTELPTPPSHSGLVFQEWNFTLEEVKSTTSPLLVGANYTTSDGKTRLYLTFLKETDTDISLALYLNSESSVVIDWGDGSETTTIDSTGQSSTPHKYTVQSFPSDVVISIAASGDVELSYSEASYGILRDNAGTKTSKALRKVELGDNIYWLNTKCFGYSPYLETISINNICTDFGGQYGSAWGGTQDDVPKFLKAVVLPKSCRNSSYDSLDFGNYYSLKKVSFYSNGAYRAIDFNSCAIEVPKIPYSISKIDNEMYSSCHLLKSLIIPDNITSIGKKAFYNCTSLREVIIPSSVINIDESAFDQCYSLKSITISNSVTSIGRSAFQSTHLLSIKFSSATPPTVDNISAWSSIPTACVIYVPTGSLTAYTTATNYPNPATYTYMEY